MLANPNASWRDEYRFASQWIDLDGHRYHYLDEGAGPQTVLAVHGNPTWSFYYRALAGELPVEQNGRAGCRVVVPDHIGCGLSDKPQNYRYTLAQHRDNLLHLIDELDLRNITLVVHDWGGAIGLSAAIEQPQRFASLVILNTGAFPPPYIPRRISACRIPLAGTLAVRGGNAFSRAAITMAVAKQPLAPKAAAGLLAPYGNWHDRVAVNAFVKDIPMQPSHPTYATLQSLEQRLPTLSHLPTRFVWGMKDWCFRPECLYRLQKVFTDQQTVELSDVGHYVMEEAPGEVIQAVRSVMSDAECAAVETRSGD
ncbi:alpha/beta fold hydrolase [Roseimaritima ulvae]|uniref:Haloalkane dehalogenase n=1 Tax=Roseimaritima ulvae TaxID=980254 RepID=A0A5B9QSG3_9BACT|nr:alpha/beta fold hydrolase [Roseimaritima ulvae]QEG40670.1 Haloalkane dehalogenase [Roseimaritima ulvae]